MANTNLTESFATYILLPSVVFKFTAMIIGVMGNTTVIIYNIFLSKEKTMTSYLVGNLALADLLVCLTFYPVWIIEFIQTILNIDSDQDLFCKLSRSSLLALLFVSVATLLVITIDRYIFIAKPLKYPLIVTQERVRNIVAAIWVISCGVLSLTAVYFKKPRRQPKRSYCQVLDEIYWPYETVILYIPIIIIFSLNLKILRIARNQKRRILQETVNVGQPNESRPNRRISSFRQTIALKSVKIFIIIVSILALCCFIPAVIGISLYFVCKTCDATTTWYVVFNFELYGINSIANAFVYGIRDANYRKSLRQHFSRLCRR
jgi:hypothetical protein